MKHWIETYPHDIHASVALLDGKIEGWKVGEHSSTPTVFMKRERFGDYVTKTEKWTVNTPEEHDYVFTELAPKWFRQWELADDYRLSPPYTDHVEMSVVLMPNNLQQQIKEALTLDQLKQLHGKPVWCHIPSDNPVWGIVDVAYETVCLGNVYALRFDYYGEWKAFNLLDELEKSQETAEKWEKEARLQYKLFNEHIDDSRYALEVKDKQLEVEVNDNIRLRTEHTAMKEALDKIANDGINGVPSHVYKTIAQNVLSTLSKEEPE